ncbi:MAG TPA: cyanobacterial phytochrome A, partial [Cyanobacteria bacterium UBA11148]|nr:cyanobacterial phytochrome A [Cyanobacteria bacterium UBA11148]
LAELNVDLERSNTELDAFVYIASHDLKEPLRGIHNYSTFLLEDYADVLNLEGVSKLETLVRLTQRMEDLINSLLHFSRLGRNELVMRQTNLNELVDNVIEVLRMSNHKSEFEICIPRPLPTIQCDRILVEEVFTNLIGNALKYNDKPEKWVEVGWLDPVEHERIYQSQFTDEVKPPLIFYIRDNGIGIREKHIDTVFRIFKRLHGPNQYGGGTGAGLT